MIDVNRLKEQQRSKHPGFDSYLECMTRSLFTGLATFCLGFSATFFLQKLIQHKVAYDPKYNILVSALTASCACYYITSKRTKVCQAVWMAIEDKHTALKEEEF